LPIAKSFVFDHCPFSPAVRTPAPQRSLPPQAFSSMSILFLLTKPFSPFFSFFGLFPPEQRQLFMLSLSHLLPFFQPPLSDGDTVRTTPPLHTLFFHNQVQVTGLTPMFCSPPSNPWPAFFQPIFGILVRFCLIFERNNLPVKVVSLRFFLTTPVFSFFVIAFPPASFFFFFTGAFPRQYFSSPVVLWSYLSFPTRFLFFFSRAMNTSRPPFQSVAVRGSNLSGFSFAPPACSLFFPPPSVFCEQEFRFFGPHGNRRSVRNREVFFL